MTDTDRYPERIEQQEIEAAYPDARLRHCEICHEDLAYGFTEAIEPIVLMMPDGSLRTHWDSCCYFLSSLIASGIPHRIDFDLDEFTWKVTP
jgi:hypothetical protein